MAGRFRGFLKRFLSSRQRETATELASDTELLRRFVRTGDQEAFELLVWRHVQNGGIANGARIDAEIDLLKFKAQMEKAKN